MNIPTIDDLLNNFMKDTDPNNCSEFEKEIYDKYKPIIIKKFRKLKLEKINLQ